MGSSVRFSEEEYRAIEERFARHRNKNAAPQHSTATQNSAPSKAGVGQGAAAAAVPKRKKAKTGPSALELAFARQLGETTLPAPRREYRFHPDREWRLDYAWPEQQLAIEVQGMVHRIKERFLRDIEKLAYAQIHGWKVLLIAGDDVRSGRGLQWFLELWAQRQQGGRGDG